VIGVDFHVFDTYVKAKDGNTIHFDVVTDKSDTEKAISFAIEWLKEVGEESANVSIEECRFCHTQSVPEDMEIEIMTNGHYIQKIYGCPED